MIDESAITPLALAQCAFGLASLGGVAHADDEQLAPVDARTAHGHVDRNRAAILVAPGRFAGGKVDVRILAAGGEPAQARDHAGVLLGERRQQQVDAPADHFGLRIAEHALAGRIEGLDRAVTVDGHHDVLDVVEDQLQVSARLLGDFAREGARLIRHQLHRAHDAAALFIHLLVVVADGGEQRAQVDLPVRATAQLFHLLPKLRMHLAQERVHRRPRHGARTHDRRGRIQLRGSTHGDLV